MRGERIAICSKSSVSRVNRETGLEAQCGKASKQAQQLLLATGFGCWYAFQVGFAERYSFL